MRSKWFSDKPASDLVDGMGKETLQFESFIGKICSSEIIHKWTEIFPLEITFLSSIYIHYSFILKCGRFSKLCT